MFTSLENLKNGLKYTITSKEVKRNEHGHYYKYIIELQYNNKKVSFSFTDSIYNYKHDISFDILDLINCLLVDMHAFDDNASIEDFAWAYGYNMDDMESIKNTKKIYYACRNNSKKMHALFNDKELNMLENLFQEY